MLYMPLLTQVASGSPLHSAPLQRSRALPTTARQRQALTSVWWTCCGHSRPSHAARRVTRFTPQAKHRERPRGETSERAGARWLLPAEADRQRRPRSPAPSVLTPTLAASWEPMVCTGTARRTVGGRDSPQAGTRKRGRSLLPRGPTSTNRRQRRRRSRGAGRLRAGMWNTGGQSAPGRAPGCPELRPASAKAAAARTALASHTGLVSPTGVPSAAGHTVLRR